MKNKVLELLNKVDRKGMKELIAWLETTDFFTAPASTRYHSNFEQGLISHSYKVMKILEILSEKLNIKIPAESIIICGLLHDLCKANFYIKETRNRKVDGKWESYETYTIQDSEPLGHGDKSIILLSKFIKLTDFELYSIKWHMGIPTDQGDKYSYSTALEKFPNIILLQSADSISSAIFEKIIK